MKSYYYSYQPIIEVSRNYRFNILVAEVIDITKNCNKKINKHVGQKLFANFITLNIWITFIFRRIFAYILSNKLIRKKNNETA